MRKLLLVLFVAVSASAAPAYVIDSEGGALLRIDPLKGTVLDRVALPHAPSEILPSPDASKLLVLSSAKVSSAVVVDAATLAVSERIELGRNAGEAAFTPDGSAAIVLASDRLVKIDLASGKPLKTLAVRGGETFGIARDGATGIVYSKKPAQLTFVSLETLDVIATLALPGKSAAPVSLPDGDYLYSIDTAKRDGNVVHVISVPERTLVASIPVGAWPVFGGMHAESGRLFVLSDAQKKGTLHVIRGASEVAKIDTTDDPAVFRMSASGKRAWVSSRFGVTEVDLDANRNAGEVSMYSGFGTGVMRPFEFHATSDGKRGFHFWRSGTDCCMVSVLDFENHKMLEDFQTGSKGERIAAALGAAAMSVASYQAGRSSAKANGSSSFWYTLYSPAGSAAPRGSYAVRNDGAVLYALDTATDDLTAVDVQTGRRLANIDIAAGVKEVIPLGGDRLVVAADEGLAFVDTAKFEVAELLKLKGDLQDFVFTADGSTAIVLSRGEVTLLDAASGRVTARIQDVKMPSRVAFGK